MSNGDTTDSNRTLLLDLILEMADQATHTRWRANVGEHSSDVYEQEANYVVAFTASGPNHANNARFMALCDPPTIKKLISELKRYRIIEEIKSKGSDDE